MRFVFIIFAICRIKSLAFSWCTHWSPCVNSFFDLRPAVARSRSELSMISLETIEPTLLSLSAIASVTAFHEAGHLLAAKAQGVSVDSFNVGFGPKIISVNDSSNTEYALRLLPLGGYVSFPTNIVIDEATGEPVDGQINPDPDLLQNRPPIQRALVISAGVVANLLLSVLLFAGLAGTVGMKETAYNNGVLIRKSVTGSPGARAGLHPDDLITQINGRSIKGSATVVSDFVGTILATPPGDLVELDVVRPLLDQRSPGKPTQKLHVSMRPELVSGRSTIGIVIAPNLRSVTVVRAAGVLDALRFGWRETISILTVTLASFSGALSSGFIGLEVGGPLAVIQTGAAASQSRDPSSLVIFTAFLSANLAVLNALPLPVLDGGQLVFTLSELLTGRRVPRLVQRVAVGVAFVFLAALLLSTLVGDISRTFTP
jgi:membrane-associated protease RseP (regulator of RpoE activity)